MNSQTHHRNAPFPYFPRWEKRKFKQVNRDSPKKEQEVAWSYSQLKSGQAALTSSWVFNSSSWGLTISHPSKTPFLITLAVAITFPTTHWESFCQQLSWSNGQENEPFSVTAIISACVLICKLAKQKRNLGLEAVLLSFFCPLGSANVAHHCLCTFRQTTQCGQTASDAHESLGASKMTAFILLPCREEIRQLYFGGKREQNAGFMPHAQLHQTAPRGFMAHRPPLGRLASLVLPGPTCRQSCSSLFPKASLVFTQLRLQPTCLTPLSARTF